MIISSEVVAALLVFVARVVRGQDQAASLGDPLV